jgi:aspartate 1-decarboxylase
MTITLLKAKIHRAVVKQADLDYVGSITIDSELLRESGILEYEKVEIADIDNGNRFETYAIAGEAGSGIICLNGAAARCVNEGDKIIIMAYAQVTPEEAKTHKPTVLFVDQDNKIVRKANYEKHGLLVEQN